MPTVEELYDRAIELKESGDLEGAVGKVEELLAENPDYALAHTALSVFLEKLDRKDEAVEHAKKVCELEPEDPFSHMAMSIICQKAGRMTEAEQALAVAMEKQWAAHQGGESK
jgi:Flp pilus assembly protein TadD